MHAQPDGGTPCEYSIGDLATRYGLSHRTLRFYEEKALLHPTRRGRQRVFSEQDRLHLDIIMLARRLRFSLAETWRLIQARTLAPKNLPDVSASSLGLSKAQLLMRIEQLTGERAGIQRAIDELRAAALPGREVPD